MKLVGFIFFRILFLVQLLGMQAITVKAATTQYYLNDSIDAQQLLVVITNDWNSVGGRLYCFEKSNGKWVRQFSNLVVVGKKGLGIGEGIVPFHIPDAPNKNEGDLKSPAGIFKIGTAFGYADYNDAKWIRNPYIKASDTLLCVDDAKSAYYNKLVENNSKDKDWNSFEHMHRQDNYYKWGLFVDHNSTNPEPGKGSCIFLHIWENKKAGTSGCTAMKEKNLLKLLHWIDSTKKPVLVQFPKNEYLKLASQFNLPDIR